MTGSWLKKPLGSLDTETTGVDPTEARLVSFAQLYVDAHGGILGRSMYQLVNPGMPIPPEASKVHGVTDEQVLQLGTNHNEAVYYLVGHLRHMAEHNIPVVVFNARYDLTLLFVHAKRMELEWPANLSVLDPLVMDRALHRFRKGPRTLGVLCSYYGVSLDDAHSADADALAAVRLAQAMGQKSDMLAGASPRALMEAQKLWFARFRNSHQSFNKRKGRNDPVKPGWPILDEVLR